MVIKTKGVRWLMAFLLGGYFSVFSQTGTIHNENIFNDKVNSSGKSLTFFQLKNGKKDLVLKNLSRNSEFVFNDVEGPTVLTNTNFIGVNRKEAKLIIHELESDVTTVINGVTDFKWDDAKQRVLALNTQDSIVLLYNLKQKKEIARLRYKKYFIGNSKTNMVIESPNQELYDYHWITNQKRVFDRSNQPGDLKNVLWNENLNQWVFIHADSLNLYIASEKSDKLENRTTLALVNDSLDTYVDVSYYNFSFLNPNKIIIPIKNRAKQYMKSEPEIWVGSKSGKGTQEENARLLNGWFLVDLKQNRKDFLPVKSANKDFITSKYPNFFYRGSYHDELVTLNLKMELEFFDIRNGIKKDKKISGFDESTLADFKMFPFVLYFKNKHWHAYDFIKDVDYEITSKTNGVFYDTSTESHLMVDDALNQQFPIYKKRWILFNEANDVWFLDTKSLVMQRKTDGIFTDKIYRLCKTSYEIASSNKRLNVEQYIIDDPGILLSWHSTSHEKQGISLLDDKGVIPLVEDHAHYSEFIRNGNFVTYLKEKSNQPPILYLFDLKQRKEYKIHETNLWDTEINQQQTVYVKWFNASGQKRGAVIRFPLHYIEGKKYPAVFSIYERKLQTQHVYISDRKTGSGFNYRDYTRAGYFVIEPDIYYEIGNPGWSALESVEQTLDYVTNNFLIDPNRIGILGHSFGGYQTNFIITQTNRFKAAVSSGGASDILYSYLEMHQETRKPNMWRFESQQYRMGGSLFDLIENYRNNSPMSFAAKVNTPLLLWAGKEDYQVNWNQSVTWYLALKRLNKEVVLLLYPNTRHVILDDVTKMDVATKTMAWFDFYLKDSCKPNWLQ